MKIIVAVADRRQREWLARVALGVTHDVVQASSAYVASQLLPTLEDGDGMLIVDPQMAPTLLGASRWLRRQVFSIVAGVEEQDDRFAADALLPGDSTRDQVLHALDEATALLRLRARLREHVSALAGARVERFVGARQARHLLTLNP
jgi:hypothetical protein